MKLFDRKQQGFTLIELLVVIGILTVLLAIVLIAINPARHFQQANNTKRQSDVNAILNAVHQYMAQNNGTTPAGITTSAQTIGTGAGNVDLCSISATVLVPTYIADLPRDPQTGAIAGGSGTCTGATSYNTGYTILATAANRITVAAPSAQGGTTVSVTR